LGRLVDRLGWKAEARRQFERALELDPRAPAKRLRLADSVRHEVGEWLSKDGQ
jgi:Tfp pilus assembly protein PilF